MNTLNSSPVRRLLPKMVLVQAIIVGAVVVTNVAINSAHEAEESTELRAGLAARQCAIAHEIAKSALLSVEAEVPDIAEHFEDPALARHRYIRELNVVLDEWTRNQQRLLALYRQSSLSDRNVTKILEGSEESFQRITNAAEHLCDAEGKIQVHSTHDDLSTILESEPVFRQSMEVVAEAIHGENARSLSNLEAARWGSSVLILLTVFAVGRLVFKPMAKELEHAFTVMEEDAQHLQERAEEIQSLHEEVAAQNQQLQDSEAKAFGEASKAVANLAIAERAARRFQELFQGMPVACFTVDCDGLIHEWNRAAEDLFGLPGHVVFLKHVCEALPGVYGEQDSSEFCDIKQALSGNNIYERVRQYQTQDGDERWLQNNAFPFHDIQGRVVGALCASFDITSRIRSEEQSQLAEERIRNVVDAAGDAIITIDANGLISSFNLAAELIFGYSQDETLEKNISMLVPEPHRSEHDQYVQRAVDYPSDSRVLGKVRELFALRKDGSLFPIELSLSRGSVGGEVFFTGIVRDITERRELEDQIRDHALRVNEMLLQLEIQKAELEEANDRLSQLATTDGLTGLQNHRAFREALDEAFLNFTEGDELSLLILDIDRFKGFNDTFGHQAGDAVLRLVAKTISETVGDSGIVARYGGEEFAVLLPGINKRIALEVAEGIRWTVERLPCEFQQITISIGVSSATPSVLRPDMLVSLADEALYASKRAGRNRVTAWNVGMAEAA